ncbi:DNA helicase/exodeoxyribonuclease V, subunit A [Salinihabitans flavidus]|uniref:DNA 3'-5' helicase n=1 Tax=Salinihabitans flavidus TaxID=569882 RepID=A0A1H8M0Q0_9RHOB|nr:double-strand break repair helicase AddA [Salinihabitans flavidus]SEO10716.1 DNA helicase/exodeoxyribonuclease V, subunit A [Salinihabitans flavidus]
MTPRDDATENQVIAARPSVSTWLSANAGSGKTRVLTDRVARLLLDGVQPQHILCLTYTKAAASEMQNRLFRRLGDWAMRDDDALRHELFDLGIEGPIVGDRLRDARTLFARAIETPGGLKIQTIHSFCAALLRRFPLEAGVSPLFTEMEDRAATLLREEIMDEMAEGEDAPLVLDMARLLTAEDFGKLTSEIVRCAPAVRACDVQRDMPASLGISPDARKEDVFDIAFDGTEQALWAELLPALRGVAGKTYPKMADQLAAIDPTAPSFDDLETLFSLFLYQSSQKGHHEKWESKSVNFPQSNHKTAVEAVAPISSALHAFMDRVAEAKQFLTTLEAIRQSKVLVSFARRFLHHYERRKQQRGWLDFDDLIQRARALLSAPAVAQWVLYRLDGGIDHILVDEAQDTSPDQWQVIERLAQEFTAGHGARSDVKRTIFVVGDKKQSIYSFQGADPTEFDRMRAEFDHRLTAAGERLNNRELSHSFRSSEAILRLVDHCFESSVQAGFPQDMNHRAFHPGLPGRVDLWPSLPKAEGTEHGEWFDPVDRRGDTHHAVLLARKIAGQIRHMIDDKELIPSEDKGPDGRHVLRPVRAGDVMILVQRRSELFHELISACKSEGLPIAGADRLKVGAEMAVRDLGALLSFMATPEDSLSLACALRSPLFGWDEQALFDLAHSRTSRHLWQALRKRGEEFPETMEILRDLLDRTDFLRPFDLIERILTRHDGRRRLLARLGQEAEDGIDALLGQALSYERSAIPSLTGFLVWMETDGLEIKRQLDNAGDQIRVMTVHGSKGLEAPVVILPDTANREVQFKDQILIVNGTPFWNAGKDSLPRQLSTRREDMMQAQHRERLRLLYVAMTRAEKWLIVAAAGDTDKEGESWYSIVEQAMRAVGAEHHGFPTGEGLRFTHGEWNGPATSDGTPPQPETAPSKLPDYLRRPAPEPPAPNDTLNPSDLGGAKGLAGDDSLDEEAAKARGSRIHLLLEHLPAHPPADWPRIANNLLGERADIPALLSETSAVLGNADLAWLFAPRTLAEVPVTANIGQKRIHGVVDRLILSDHHVLAVDFKTNTLVPSTPHQVPDALLRQMGAYAHALKQVYPDHGVETAFLWTRSATLMRLPHDLVIDALAEALSS